MWRRSAVARFSARDSRRLYAQHLTSDARREAWHRFDHALRPLHDSGRLGCVVLQFPTWLKPGDTGRAMVTEAKTELPDYRLCLKQIDRALRPTREIDRMKVLHRQHWSPLR